MAWPDSWLVRVDWDRTGTFGTGTQDITSSVKNFNVERGKNSELDETITGMAELRVINTDKRFSPEFSSGTFYGKLKPGRPIQISATASGTSYPLFTGFLTEIKPKPSKTDQDAYIVASDSFWKLRQPVSTPLMATVTEAQLISTIISLCQASGDTIPISADAGLETFPYYWLQQANALQAMQHQAKVARGRVYSNPSGTVIFENRNHRGAHVSSGTFDNDFYDLQYSYADRDLRNYVVTSYEKWDIPYGTVYLLVSQTYYLAGTSSMIVTLPYISPGTIRPQSGGTSLFINSSADLGGTDLSANVIQDIRPYAADVYISLNNTSNTPCYWWLGVLGATVSQFYATLQGTVIAIDATSQSLYGVKRDVLSQTFLATSSVALARSSTLLAKYKVPVPELNITLRPDDGTKLTHMLIRDISDRITVLETQTAVNGDFFIEKVRHEYHANPRVLETMWVLSAGTS